MIVLHPNSDPGRLGAHRAHTLPAHRAHTHAMAEQRYVIGVDGGTESLRAAVFECSQGRVLGSAAAPYPTTYPRPGWVEQEPEHWWQALGSAVAQAVSSSGVQPSQIAAVCVDTTCCTVCALDADGNALRPALLWADMRSAAEAAQVAACTGDPALRVNSAGRGPVSAEWMLPKCLWLNKHERHQTWARAVRVGEYQDYINAKLTGRWCASLNNATVRWHYDKERGWPVSLHQRLGLDEDGPLVARFPRDLLAPGEVVGPLTPQAAQHLGLLEGTPVVQGGADAFIGMLGLGVVQPGQMALLTGSSHLQLGMVSERVSGQGFFGSYTAAVLPGLNVVEGGQTSTGSVVHWFKRTLCGPEGAVSYDQLNQEAQAVPPGCDGLLCLDHFQGNRTPYTDALSRGGLVGLTLAHTRGHVFRSMLEGVAMGTRLILETMAKAGYAPSSIAIAGGATRSDLWLQIHADVCDVPFILTTQPEAPMLGCAILAAVATGLHASVDAAAAAMVQVARVVRPRPEVHAQYEDAYQRYKRLYPALAPLQPGHFDAAPPASAPGPQSWTVLEAREAEPGEESDVSSPALQGVVAPSILASDFSRLAEEVQACMQSGAQWVHVDVFDGSELCRGNFTLGPPVVQSLRQALPHAVLDCHLAVDDPFKHVRALARAGASHVTFHIDAPGLLSASTHQGLQAFGGLADLLPAQPLEPPPQDGANGHDLSSTSAYRRGVASALAQYVRLHGARAGLALSPSTPVDDAVAVCQAGGVDLVLIMTVEPGWGGQAFLGDKVLPNVRALRQACPWIDVQVDGGITAETARLVVQAGANVLVAGSSVFGRKQQQQQQAGGREEGVYGAAVRALTDVLGGLGRLPLAPVPGAHGPAHYYEWESGALRRVDPSTRTKQALTAQQAQALGQLVLQPGPQPAAKGPVASAHHFEVRGGALLLWADGSAAGAAEAQEAGPLPGVRLVPVPAVVHKAQEPRGRKRPFAAGGAE